MDILSQILYYKTADVGKTSALLICPVKHIILGLYRYPYITSPRPTLS